MKEKVYEPEVIEENPFPSCLSQFASQQSQSVGGGAFSPVTTKEGSFPPRKIAVELIGQALNTKSKRILQEFELVQSGGFKVGDYKEGITGELKITPNGLTAKDKAGITTFAIDGETGDAVFAGTVQSGAVIAGDVVVGNNNVVIQGSEARILIYDDTGVPIILLGKKAGAF